MCDNYQPSKGLGWGKSIYGKISPNVFRPPDSPGEMPALEATTESPGSACSQQQLACPILGTACHAGYATTSNVDYLFPSSIKLVFLVFFKKLNLSYPSSIFIAIGRQFAIPLITFS
jgi:hypothetical protein